MVSTGHGRAALVGVIVASRRRRCAEALPDEFPPECTHSTVRIFPDNVLPCPVVHQRNSRTTHRMNQPPLRTAHFLFDTNENSLNFLTPTKQRALAISIRYKWSHFARSLIRNFFAHGFAFHQSSLATDHETIHQSLLTPLSHDHSSQTSRPPRRAPQAQRRSRSRRRRRAPRARAQGRQAQRARTHRPAAR